MSGRAKPPAADPLLALGLLGSIIGRIAKFERTSKQDEYTDTDEAREMLHAIKADAQKALKALGSK